MPPLRRYTLSLGPRWPEERTTGRPQHSQGDVQEQAGPREEGPWGGWLESFTEIHVKKTRALQLVVTICFGVILSVEITGGVEAIAQNPNTNFVQNSGYKTCNFTSYILVLCFRFNSIVLDLIQGTLFFQCIQAF